MKILAISQARAGSKRLPGKIFKQLLGKSMLEIHLLRVMSSIRISKLMVATTLASDDDATEQIAKKLGLTIYRGKEDDVLDRFYQAAKNEQCDYIVRITADCPLIDPVIIDKVIEIAIGGNYDYTSNTLHPTYPDGTDVEVFKFSALQKAWKEAIQPSDREHVTPYIWRNSSYNDQSKFTSYSVENQINFSAIRITVDELVDFELIKKLMEELGTDKSWEDYTAHILTNPTYLNLNSHLKRSKA